MTSWLLRGLAFAALMVFIRLVQGAAINAWETKAGLISVTLVVLYAIAAFVWGLIDGRKDAESNPDPDRRADLSMTWLLAGLFAGIVSGAVAWLISLFYKDLYVGGLINELTTFAAFTALLTFLAALAGVALGHWLIDRHEEKVPRKHHGLAATDEDRADTDVFAAVRQGDAADRTETAPVARDDGFTEVRREEQR
jgi:MFS family permease